MPLLVSFTVEGSQQGHFSKWYNSYKDITSALVRGYMESSQLLAEQYPMAAERQEEEEVLITIPRQYLPVLPDYERFISGGLTDYNNQVGDLTVNILLADWLEDDSYLDLLADKVFAEWSAESEDRLLDDLGDNIYQEIMLRAPYHFLKQTQLKNNERFQLRWLGYRPREFSRRRLPTTFLEAYRVYDRIVDSATQPRSLLSYNVPELQRIAKNLELPVVNNKPRQVKVIIENLNKLFGRLSNSYLG